jgi:antitoxin component YwqK of YwqJK toxin-antitoxin module
MPDNDVVSRKSSKLSVAFGWIGIVTAVAGLLMTGGLGSWSMPYIEGYGGNQNPLVGIPNSAMFLADMGARLLQYRVGRGLLVISAISITIWVVANNNKTKNYVALGLVAITVGITGFGNVFEFSKKTPPIHLQRGYYMSSPWLGICTKDYTRKGLDVFSYGNRKKAFEGHSVAGVSQGLHTGWFENGQKSFEVNCVDGRNEGLQVGWHENGQKSFEYNLLNRNNEGFWNGFRQGSSRGWHENGQMSYEQNFVDGQQVSGTEWHENGQKASEATYGQEASGGLYTYWHDNGQLSSQRISEPGGVPGIGILTKWHPNGQKMSEVNYYDSFDNSHSIADHNKNGLATNWHRNGQKSFEKSWVKGRQHGAETRWYANGQMRVEENYVNGRADGTESKWYEDGQLESQMTYSDGDRVGVWTAWHWNGQIRYQSGGANDGRWDINGKPK